MEGIFWSTYALWSLTLVIKACHAPAILCLPSIQATHHGAAGQHRALAGYHPAQDRTREEYGEVLLPGGGARSIRTRGSRQAMGKDRYRRQDPLGRAQRRGAG